MEHIDFPVCVRCFTFNHALYIEDAMNGFCMQKTNYPYVCVIVDDASKDGEQEVIESYLQEHFDLEGKTIVKKEETEDYILTFARHKENLNCFFAVLFLKYNHYSINKPKMPYLTEWLKHSEYEAVCEGDDYWIDSYKLQKQYDALESHPDCTIAFCKIKDVSRDGTDLKKTKPNGNYVKQGVVTLKDFFKFQYGKNRWVFQTSGYFYRTQSVNGLYDSTLYKNYPYGDEPLVIWCLLNGNGFYISDICSCYRNFAGGYMSNWKNKHDFLINAEKKVIVALSYLDDYTKKQYNCFIRNRILFAEYTIIYYQGEYSKMFNFKYLKLILSVPIKILIIMNLRVLCPPLYWALKRHLNSKN